MLIAGVDEAGRGPVVGPMVIAGFGIDEDRIPELEALGVKDSKKLSPKKRATIGAALRAMGGVSIEERVIAPPEIDAAVSNRSITLNGLEISVIAAVLDRIRPEVAFIDLVGVSEQRFALSIMRLLTSPPRLVCRAKADATFLVTAAASILAKTRRDAEIERIGERYADRYGPVGSGYPSDRVTMAFVKAAAAEEGIIRRSWGSVRRSGDA